MMNFAKIVAAGGLVLATAGASFAQSGPVDSKGQAGAVQQLGSGVTKGTNGKDAAASRERLGISDSATPTSQMSVNGGQPTETTGTMRSSGYMERAPSNPQAQIN